MYTFDIRVLQFFFTKCKKTIKPIYLRLFTRLSLSYCEFWIGTPRALVIYIASRVTVSDVTEKHHGNCLALFISIHVSRLVRFLLASATAAAELSIKLPGPLPRHRLDAHIIIIIVITCIVSLPRLSPSS